ncbi:alpha/beta fold hydrolase [Marinobacterium lutimaris]|uniref:Pimeloyl-ACP methyl ester carboxylesterase n=1 Tax=Marinobacterium lutimaris TaxID=568106 RepID=A0A1H6DLE3_9GAMM|nr:alpha/beta hydrolase [Marinobacterium lutimaris]SEG85999.1 Pimeloyl-ACP methyl ester carboxylesterase [Marinobacterium lutimaris]
MRRGNILSLDSGGFHRLHYQEWGSASNERVLICVHGMARNSRDFDELALALSRNYRVICPDLPGRGESDWLANPKDYSLVQYVQDMVALIARVDAARVDWIGTSLGGLIGICLAAQPNTPIRRLVLNDIGPFIPQAALQRIAGYLGDHRFDDESAMESWLRDLYTAFSGLSDRQWQHLVTHGQRQCDDGRLGLHYDPAIAVNAAENSRADVDIWSLWERVDCPQLLLHGRESDVLRLETVQQMQSRRPDLQVHSLDGIGHAPALMSKDQITLLVDWLRATQSQVFTDKEEL